MRSLLRGMIFTVVGDLESGKTHDELGEIIKKIGGVFSPSLRNNVTHVVSSTDAYSSDHYKLRRARRKKMFIVHEKFILDTFSNKKNFEEEDYKIDKFIAPKVSVVSSSKPIGNVKRVARVSSDEILPIEVWREILFFLDTKFLVNVVSQVNKSFHSIVNSDSFLRTLCLRKVSLPFLCNRNRTVSKVPEKMTTIYEHISEKSWKDVYKRIPDKKYFFDKMAFYFNPIPEHHPLRYSRKDSRLGIENAFHFQNSKMGGYPLLLEEEEWPKCTECGKYLIFFFQVNTNELPPNLSIKVPSNSLFQFFFCAAGDDNDLCCYEEGSEEDSKMFRWIRNLDQVGDGRGKYDIYKYHKDPWKEYLITGWKMKLDISQNSDDYDEEMLKIEFKDSEDVFDAFWLYVEKYHDFATGLIREGENCNINTHTGLKLGGFGNYIQGEEPGKCRKCDGDMVLLFEVDESKQMPLMWGDAGAAWLHYCQNCQDKNGIEFCWSCT